MSVREALDQARPVVYPAEEDAEIRLNRSHAALVDQHLGGGLEGVGTDLEGGVVGELELAQLGTQPCHQHAEADRLGDVVVGT